MSEPKEMPMAKQKIPTLLEKLFSIQCEIKNPIKDTQGYGYKYATLEQVLDLIKPHLEKQKLLLTQVPMNEGQMIGVETVIQCLTDDEVYQNKFFVEVPKKDPQGYGSAITYCRRYALVSMFNLAPEDDDGRASITEDKKLPPKNPAPSLTDQIDNCLKQIKDKEFTQKVAAFIAKKNDHLSLAATLSRCQARLKEQGQAPRK